MMSYKFLRRMRLLRILYLVMIYILMQMNLTRYLSQMNMLFFLLFYACLGDAKSLFSFSLCLSHELYKLL